MAAGPGGQKRLWDFAAQPIFSRASVARPHSPTAIEGGEGVAGIANLAESRRRSRAPEGPGRCRPGVARRPLPRSGSRHTMGPDRNEWPRGDCGGEGGSPPLKPRPRGSLGRSRSPLGAPKAFRPAHLLRSAPEGRPPLEPFGSGNFPSTRAAARAPAPAAVWRVSRSARPSPFRERSAGAASPGSCFLGRRCGECMRPRGGRQAFRLVGFRVPRRLFARCRLRPR